MEEKEIKKLAKTSVSYGKKTFHYFKSLAVRTLAGALAMMGVKQRRIDLEFGEDDDSWTCQNPLDPKRRLIHVGLFGFVMFPDGTPMFESFADWCVHMRYILSHEIGHILYTTNRAWTMMLDNGTRNVVSYIAERALGRKVRIADENSLRQTITLVHDQAHLNINLNMIRQMVHFVGNSIEDGRTERIQAAGNPGFKTDMRIRRGKTWEHSPVTDDFDPDSEIGLLFTVCNQILSLATTGLWQKGFMDNLAGTKVETTVRPMIPKIRAGVTAHSCKKGMQKAVEIIDDLCPLFYDACVSDVNEELENALQEFMDKMAQMLPDMPMSDQEQETSYDADEKSDAEAAKKDEEEEKSGKPQNNGDYQLSSDGSGSEVQVTFNIFTDDAEDEDDTDGEDNGAGSGKDNTGEDDSSGTGSGQNGKPGSDENGNRGTGEDGGGNEGAAADETGNESSASANGNANGENGSGQQGSQKSPAAKGDKSFARGGMSGSKGQHVEHKGTDEEAVQAAMEEAAKAAEAEASFTERAIQGTGAPKKKETSDMSSVQDTVTDLEDICDDFNEFFRAYRLTEDLPSEIAQECRVTRAKYEHYFVSRRKPAQRGAKTGRLDLGALTRVSTRNLDVFMRPGEDNSFSGCIYVLVDNSGSMSGNKKWNAMAICARLEEIFKGLVPLKIAAFDWSDGTNFEIIKNWNDDFIKNCSWNYLKYSRDGGGTPTSEALLVARGEMMARPERHKLIILITDESARYSADVLPSVISSVRKSGIQLSAAYIEDCIDQDDKDSFESLFGKGDSIVALPEELSGAILPVVKKFTAK